MVARLERLIFLALALTISVAVGRAVYAQAGVALVLETSGRQGVVDHVPPRKGDVRHSLADISAARAAFGYDPRVPLEAGLQEYMHWGKRVLMAAV